MGESTSSGLLGSRLLFSQVWLSHSVSRAIQDTQKLDYNACAYFEFSKTDLHTCSGSHESHGRHVELIAPSKLRKVLHQLTATDYKRFKGDVLSWFTALISLDRNPIWQQSGCWRVNREGERLCSGSRTDCDNLIISIPVILIIETADDLPAHLRWDFPETLFTSSSSTALNEKRHYELVGFGLHSHADNHFMARFRDDKDIIYAYNDLENSGWAVPIPGATVSSHLTGDSIPLPPTYKICSAVYRLEGGTDAQMSFFKTRQAQLESYHHIRCSTGVSLYRIPDATYVHPDFEKMDAADCFWLGNPFTERSEEYILSKQPSDSEDDLTINKPDGSASATAIAPRKPYRVIKSPPSNTEDILPSQSSVSSVPNEDFNLICRCGDRVDGNKVYDSTFVGEAASCDACRRWVHIACQKGGRAHGLTEQSSFFCDRCNPHDLSWTNVDENLKKRER